MARMSEEIFERRKRTVATSLPRVSPPVPALVERRPPRTAAVLEGELALPAQDVAADPGRRGRVLDQLDLLALLPPLVGREALGVGLAARADAACDGLLGSAATDVRAQQRRVERA